ncbi:MAG: 50S ribosomal protein L23 [Patescibacteria group bacterium]|nr:50S ribosomal protein L23 [Patescibacteria group bacterium]
MTTLKKNKIKKTKADKNQKIVSINTSARNIFSVKQPWITEKSHKMTAENRYVFIVDKNANKSEVKKTIKSLYKVDPISINIIITKGKEKKFRGIASGKSSIYKKAIITLKKGQKIDIMPSA